MTNIVWLFEERILSISQSGKILPSRNGKKTSVHIAVIKDNTGRFLLYQANERKWILNDYTKDKQYHIHKDNLKEIKQKAAEQIEKILIEG